MLSEPLEDKKLLWGLSLVCIGVSMIVKIEDSYRLYGSHTYSIEQLLEGAQVRVSFHAVCKLCSAETPSLPDSEQVLQEHFQHCSRFHGYILPESAVKFLVKDRSLQDSIIACMEYDLADLPGYETHNCCVRMYKGEMTICVIHEGNEVR